MSVQRPQVVLQKAPHQIIGKCVAKNLWRGARGVFPAAELVQAELMTRFNVKHVGPCDGVQKHFLAIGVRTKVLRPVVQKLLP